jgi:high-affinity nickel permease
MQNVKHSANTWTKMGCVKRHLTQASSCRTSTLIMQLFLREKCKHVDNTIRLMCFVYSVNHANTRLRKCYIIIGIAISMYLIILLGVLNKLVLVSGNCDLETT